MRLSRQVMWIGLAGVLVCASTAVTRASLRLTQRRSIETPGWCDRALASPAVTAVDPFDDEDASGILGTDRGIVRVSTRSFEHALVANRAPVTTRNRPAPHRLKLPSPVGDDVPAH